MDKHYEEFVRAREERERYGKALRRKRRIQKQDTESGGHSDSYDSVRCINYRNGA